MKSITITPSKLNGRIEIPASKSLCHRAIICAAMAKGKSRLTNIADSDDIQTTINAVKALGAEVTAMGNGTYIIDGTNTFQKDDTVRIDCRGSGSTLRFLIPLAFTNPTDVIFTGRERIAKRSLKTYTDLFDKCDAEYVASTNLSLPITIKNGNLSGGIIELSSKINSQFLSGLLFALPMLSYDTEIKFSAPFKSKGYIDMTIDMLEKFGIKIYNYNYTTFRIHGFQEYKPFDYNAEGDFSHAAFYLAAGALGNFVVCNGLNLETRQNDKKITEIIEQMNGKIVVENGCIAAVPTLLKGSEINISDCPDLLPAVAVMAIFAQGETIIYGIENEKERVHTVTEQLNSLGATIIEQPDRLIIEGVDTISGGTASSCNDHRIAMALAIASTCCDSIVCIDNSECINKSYPTFWEHFNSLGGFTEEWIMKETGE